MQIKYIVFSSIHCNNWHNYFGFLSLGGYGSFGTFEDTKQDLQYFDKDPDTIFD